MLKPRGTPQQEASRVSSLSPSAGWGWQREVSGVCGVRTPASSNTHLLRRHTQAFQAASRTLWWSLAQTHSFPFGSNRTVLQSRAVYLGALILVKLRGLLLVNLGGGIKILGALPGRCQQTWGKFSDSVEVKRSRNEWGKNASPGDRGSRETERKWKC